MKLSSCLLALALIISPALAEALSRDEAYALARSGDAAAIEAAFSAHQASFNGGEIGPGAYRSPYWVFNTTEPKVEATLDDWLEAYPGSPQAAVARAIQLSHIALLVRGERYARETPSAAMNQFREMATEALDLARQALDAEPRHLAAAYELMTMGAFLGRRDDRDRGFLAIEKLDTPAKALLSGLQFNLKRWGGGQEAINRFCEERAPLVPDISVEECLALADYKERHRFPDRAAAAVALLSEGSEKHFLEQHIAALFKEGKPEEAYELARSRGYMTYELAHALANSLGDMSYVKDFVERRLRDDPLNPEDLAAHASMLTQAGEREAAWETFDLAMMYGAHQSSVWRSRLHAVWRDPERAGALLDEISDALDATDDDVSILDGVLISVMFPDERVTHLDDGTPNPDFECKRLRILERHRDACEAGGNRFSCEPGLAIRRDTIITEARAQAVCGEATGRTWQDVVRYLLNLTE